jgi:hypothetical protein
VITLAWVQNERKTASTFEMQKEKKFALTFNHMPEMKKKSFLVLSSSFFLSLSEKFVSSLIQVLPIGSEDEFFCDEKTKNRFLKRRTKKTVSGGDRLTRVQRGSRSFPTHRPAGAYLIIMNQF